MIPFFDKNTHYFNYKKEIDAAIQKVVNSGQFILGEEVIQFEKEFAAFHQIKYGVGVANGTDAIFLALKALGIQAGDEVVVPNNTYVGTVNAVKMTGATPVFAVHNQFYLLDVTTVSEVLTPKTKAIIPVHLYGQMCNMQPIAELAKKHNLKVVEDAAQAHGATYNGYFPGYFSDAATFSFYPTKNLGAFGDGGMVISNNLEVIEKVRFYARQGLNLVEMKFEGGVNSRLDELQAAVLRVKLRYLNEINCTRNEIANMYLEVLKNTEGITLPKIQDKVKHVFHQFVVKSERATFFREKLLKNGIPTEVHYPYVFKENYLIEQNGVFSIPVTSALIEQEDFLNSLKNSFQA